MIINQTKSALIFGILFGLTGIAPTHAVTRGFFTPKPVTGATDEYAKKIVVADFNNDGKPDFATLHWEIDDRCVVQGVDCNRGFFVKTYINNTPLGARDPSFQLSADLLNYRDGWRLYPVWNNDMLAEDVNGDDVVDIVVANAHDDVIVVYPGIKDPQTGQGTGQFQKPVETKVDDDPSYLAIGHFLLNAGLPELFIRHYDRDELFTGPTYDVGSSSYKFNNDGTLSKVSSLQYDIWGDYERTPYYAMSNAFIATLPATSIVNYPHVTPESLSADQADVIVQQLGPMDRLARYAKSGILEKNWYSLGFNQSLETCNKQRIGDNCILGEFYSTKYNAFAAGSILSELDTQSNLINYRKYDGLLENFFSSRLLANTQGESGAFGSAVLMDDFDNDGHIDLVLLSGINLIKKYQENTDQAILIAYGDITNKHPLNTSPAIGFDTTQIKILGNSTGRYGLGHKNWRWAVSDFNRDGFQDLVSITDSGIMIHSNYGNFAQDATPPVLVDISSTTVKAGTKITVSGNFNTGDRLANWVELIDFTMGRPHAKFLIAVDPDSIESPFQTMTFTIPDKITQGIYELRMTNTMASSQRSFTINVK